MPRVLLIVPLLALTACASLGTGNAFGHKAVVEKQEPTDLIAADRTVCTVSDERFRETEVGDDVWCLWKGETGEGGGVAVGGGIAGGVTR